jgi:peptidoglycan/LPS O-acetylase OafA/YrhL
MNVKRAPKFEYLDGLRGISALYVLLYHAVLFTGYVDKTFPAYCKPILTIISFGHFAVPVFIVLSGYCLMIPVVMNNGYLRGGFKQYISRRFKRIIPPYYIAMVLFIVLINLIPVLQVSNNTAWDSKIPFDWQAIVAHLLLIHNLRGKWIFKIDGPMWSVATEWQIYFIFPLLLFIYRKCGVLLSLLTGIVIGVLFSYSLSILHPWYLGLFSMGMVASIITLSDKEIYLKLRRKINWPLLLIISFMISLIPFAFQLSPFYSPIAQETAVGLFISVLLIYFSLLEINNTSGNWILKFLKSRFSMKLGVFSYSIYLIHSPLLALFNLLTINIPMSPQIRLAAMFAIAVPFSILCSYVFYLLVEKRFASHNSANSVTFADRLKTGISRVRKITAQQS